MVAAILLDRKKRVLVVQRPASGLLGGLWKFPGGEIGAKESVNEAACRTVREEIGLSIRLREAVASVKHAYTHFRVTCHVYRCAIVRGRPKSVEGFKWKWASAEDLRGLALPKAERKILDVLQS
jgi:A/G-specific adenine glycosylase